MLKTMYYYISPYAEEKNLEYTSFSWGKKKQQKKKHNTQKQNRAKTKQNKHSWEKRLLKSFAYSDQKTK